MCLGNDKMPIRTSARGVHARCLVVSEMSAIVGMFFPPPIGFTLELDIWS